MSCSFNLEHDDVFNFKYVMYNAEKRMSFTFRDLQRPYRHVYWISYFHVPAPSSLPSPSLRIQTSRGSWRHVRKPHYEQSCRSFLDAGGHTWFTMWAFFIDWYSSDCNQPFLMLLVIFTGVCLSFLILFPFDPQFRAMWPLFKQLYHQKVDLFLFSYGFGQLPLIIVTKVPACCSVFDAVCSVFYLSCFWRNVIET